MNASIAAFSYGLVPNTNLTMFMDVIFFGPRGLTTKRWTGLNSWEPEQNPEVMAAVDSSTELAANTDKHVYATQNGEVKEFTVSDDGQTWSEVGVVATG